MSNRIKELLERNQAWAEDFEQTNPGVFDSLARQQNPDYLWIGCSDSRVPANTIMGRQPGEVFVHRNIANLVNHSDLSVLSVLEYAVNVLKVNDIILCGHYGCGGVKAALENKEHGIVDNWLRAIKDICHKHHPSIEQAGSESDKLDRLCELNVKEQVRNICHTSIVQKAWMEGHDLAVHGVIYGIENGILKDLEVTTTSIEEIETIYHLYES